MKKEEIKRNKKIKKKEKKKKRKKKRNRNRKRKKEKLMAPQDRTSIIFPQKLCDFIF